VIAILVIGPFLGVVCGVIAGGLLLPADPTGHSAPGDGFLVMLCAVVGLLVSIAASVMLADRSWRHSANLKTRRNSSEVPPGGC
jgi:Co/Zn/Cd efflux system component